MKVHRLQSQWEIWFAYLSELEQNLTGYSNRLCNIHSLETSNDLVYLWTQSPIASLKNFFVFSAGLINQAPSYIINNQKQKVSSINFFKKGIEPRWEDPENEKGGRYLFQVNRDQQNHELIYSALVFYLIGEDFQGSQFVNGFRFISAKFKLEANFLFRVQVWVNYNEQNTQKILVFRNNFTKFLAENQIKGINVSFRNNK